MKIKARLGNRESSNVRSLDLKGSAGIPGFVVADDPSGANYTVHRSQILEPHFSQVQQVCSAFNDTVRPQNF